MPVIFAVRKLSSPLSLCQFGDPLVGQPGDVLLEGAVDEAVVRARALEEDAVAHGIEKGDEAEWEESVEKQEETQQIVLDHSHSSVILHTC